MKIYCMWLWFVVSNISKSCGSVIVIESVNAEMVWHGSTLCVVCCGWNSTIRLTMKRHKY
ncbi:hypothetical protein U3516DRAFT_773771 [Neocallimastix sp. 'constans']